MNSCPVCDGKECLDDQPCPLCNDHAPFVAPRNHEDMQRLELETWLYDLQEDYDKVQRLLIQVWHFAKDGLTLPAELWVEIDDVIQDGIGGGE